MHSKAADEVVDATKEILNNIGTPQQIYSDQEPTFCSPSFVRLMNERKIKTHFNNKKGTRRGEIE